MGLLDTTYFDKVQGWCYVTLEGEVVDGFDRESDAKRGFSDYIKEELRKKRCPTCED